jgi:hypothetical protein
MAVICSGSRLSELVLGKNMPSRRFQETSRRRGRGAAGILLADFLLADFLLADFMG